MIIILCHSFQLIILINLIILYFGQISNNHSIEKHCHCGMKLNLIGIAAILILPVSTLFVYITLLKVCGVHTLGGLVQRALNGKKTLSLSSIKRKNSLKMRYFSKRGKHMIWHIRWKRRTSGESLKSLNKQYWSYFFNKLCNLLYSMSVNEIMLYFWQHFSYFI